MIKINDKMYKNYLRGTKIGEIILDIFQGVCAIAAILIAVNFAIAISDKRDSLMGTTASLGGEIIAAGLLAVSIVYITREICGLIYSLIESKLWAQYKKVEPFESNAVEKIATQMPDGTIESIDADGTIRTYESMSAFINWYVQNH